VLTVDAGAVKLIGKAALPLFGGLATDVEGMRAVMSIADRSGGIVDHALSEAQYRNFKILQTTGWTTTTLTETRNRADLIIIAGSDIRAHAISLPAIAEAILADAAAPNHVGPQADQVRHVVHSTAKTKVGGEQELILLSLAFAAIVACNLAFWRHLRRVYASPRRGVWRRV